MRLEDAIKVYPEVRVFHVRSSDNDQTSDWDVEVSDRPVLSQKDGFFILKAKNILPDGSVRDCYIDLSMPERISDYVYQMCEGCLEACYHHELGGEIVCAVPICSFGIYELFYSRKQPDIGIEILKTGLKATNKRAAIAEDLGFILRDERRFREAAEAFEISVREGPSSNFIFDELAGCYDELGEKELGKKYRQLFEK
jgi:hypothetical protein